MDRLGLIAILALIAVARIVAHATAHRRGAAMIPEPVPAAAWHPLVGGTAVDTVTSTEVAWFERLRVEQHRHQRYGRPATIVAMHLGGSTGALGSHAAPRHAQDVRHARHIEAAVRSTDIVRAGSDGIVRILLTETDEDGGDACVRRLAERLPGWDTEAGPTSHLTAAWASMRGGRDLSTANRLALARLRGVQAGWLRCGAVHLDVNDVSRTAPGPDLRGSRS